MYVEVPVFDECVIVCQSKSLCHESTIHPSYVYIYIHTYIHIYPMTEKVPSYRSHKDSHGPVASPKQRLSASDPDALESRNLLARLQVPSAVLPRQRPGAEIVAEDSY